LLAVKPKMMGSCIPGLAFTSQFWIWYKKLRLVVAQAGLRGPGCFSGLKP
jgi:hypothetical protein